MTIQLHDVDAPVTPLQIMTKIICTLPPSYRSCNTAWDSVPANKKTIAMLASRLPKEETMATRLNGGWQDSLDAAFLLHIVLQLPRNSAHPHVDEKVVKSNKADHQNIIHIQNVVIAASLITSKKCVVCDFEMMRQQNVFQTAMPRQRLNNQAKKKI